MPMLTRITLIVLCAMVVFSSVAIAQHEEDVFVGQKAPELKKLPVWLNSAPLSLEALRGKVVLLQFWAFDCPFCAEATPKVIDWHQKYSKDGLVVIAVHVPRVE